MKNFQITRFVAAVMLTLALSVASSSTVEAKQAHDGGLISGIVVFGDSLSDNGNFFALTGQPAKPYFKGRVSNGIVWVEHLAKALKLRSDSVLNFAFAGATTGRDNENDFSGVEFPGLQDELDFFEASLNGQQADPNALYIVWAGANDFFVSGASLGTISTGVTNTAIAVQRLYQAGARRIMVVNLPDLGLTPFGRSTDPTGLSFVSAFYNAALDSALDELAAQGLETIRVDSAAVLQDVVANPWEYRLFNVTDSYLETGGGPARFLFWDSVHPTTRGHSFIAQEALRVLRQSIHSGS